MRIDFVFSFVETSSVDYNEMPHLLGLHRLSKDPFMSFRFS